MGHYYKDSPLAEPIRAEARAVVPDRGLVFGVKEGDPVPYYPGTEPIPWPPIADRYPI